MAEKLDVLALIAGYERNFEYDGRSRPYLYLPCSDPAAKQGMLISFGAWGGGYNRIRGYFESCHATHDLLYLQDNLGHEGKGVWYLCEDGDFWVEEIYTALIEGIVAESGLPREKVHTFGSSMGGFAALYYAFKLGLGKTVAICPIIGVQSRYPKLMPEMYRRIMPYPEFDLDGYIFRMFARTVPTETHLILCRDDERALQTGVDRLMSSLIRHCNRFSVHCYDISRPDGVTAHNATMLAAGKDEVLRLLETSLRIDGSQAKFKPGDGE